MSVDSFRRRWDKAHFKKPQTDSLAQAPRNWFALLAWGAMIAQVSLIGCLVNGTLPDREDEPESRETSPSRSASGGTTSKGSGGAYASNNAPRSNGTNDQGGYGGDAQSGDGTGNDEPPDTSSDDPGGSNEPPTSNSGATLTDVRNIIQARCVGCHDDRSPILGGSESELYNVLRSRAVALCGGDKLVTPGDPANSAIIGLLTGKCNISMPPSCKDNPCIPEADVATIESWIEAGAPE